MAEELKTINEDETLTDKERGSAKGGAIGDTVGSIAGSAGGAVAGGLLAAIATSALAGTAIGTAVPGLGNIAGLLIGAGVGAAGFYFGGKAGRAIGAGIGGAAAGDDAGAQQVNDLIVTPGGTFSTHPDDYIMAMKKPEALAGDKSAENGCSMGTATLSAIGSMAYIAETLGRAGINALESSRNGTGSSATVPNGALSLPAEAITIINPTALRNEVRSAGSVTQTVTATVEGEILLRSELVIDDRGYRLRQAVEKNTTPYKFAVGNAGNAREIQ